MPKGSLIAIEGIDGAGKRTQLDLLCAALQTRGVIFHRMSFPRYSSFFGTLVGRFLNGEFGALPQVNPHLSALLYAGDRFEARKEMENAIERGKTIVTDRYIGSNLAHQTARMPSERRETFLAWLRRLEYDVYSLPQEDLVIYLRLPASEAQRLVTQKASREYTEKKMDIQEADIAHLEAAASVYDRLAKEPNWAQIECFDEKKSSLRSPEEIHADVMKILEARRLVK
jgi:dTMP kinase